MYQVYYYFVLTKLTVAETDIRQMMMTTRAVLWFRCRASVLENSRNFSGNEGNSSAMTSTRAATIAKLVIPRPINSARELPPNDSDKLLFSTKTSALIPRKNYHLATDNAEPNHAAAQHVGFEHVFSPLRELQRKYTSINPLEMCVCFFFKQNYHSFYICIPKS
jgi:hypothetical protein